ncbi:MAG: AraC family ligand binding domain-containing protein [Planctomycetota bacterium]
MRHEDGSTRLEPGDAFLFRPGEPHPLQNDGAEDLVYYTIAGSDTGYLLGIECTLRSLDADGKLGKLKVRIHELASALPDLHVRGVAVSAAYGDLAAEVQEAMNQWCRLCTLNSRYRPLGRGLAWSYRAIRGTGSGCGPIAVLPHQLGGAHRGGAGLVCRMPANDRAPA